MTHVVQKRVHPGLEDVFVLGQIKGRIKKRMRIKSLEGSMHHVVQQWYLVRVSDRRVPSKVKLRTEKRMRIPTFSSTVGQIVPEGIDPRFAHVRVGCKIKVCIEQNLRYADMNGLVGSLTVERDAGFQQIQNHMGCFGYNKLRDLYSIYDSGIGCRSHPFRNRVHHT